jgi:hypothetical protein
MSTASKQFPLDRFNELRAMEKVSLIHMPFALH